MVKACSRPRTLIRGAAKAEVVRKSPAARRAGSIPAPGTTTGPSSDGRAYFFYSPCTPEVCPGRASSSGPPPSTSIAPSGLQPFLVMWTKNAAVMSTRPESVHSQLDLHHPYKARHAKGPTAANRCAEAAPETRLRSPIYRMTASPAASTMNTKVRNARGGTRE